VESRWLSSLVSAAIRASIIRGKLRKPPWKAVQRITALATLLVVPLAAFAKDFYPITLVIVGDPHCTGQPKHRMLIVDGETISAPNPFGTCSGQLTADGTFGFSCVGGGRAPTTSYSGKILGPNIEGNINSEVYLGSLPGGQMDIKCSGTFHGTASDSPPPRP
jgi:hypothetical protein